MNCAQLARLLQSARACNFSGVSHTCHEAVTTSHREVSHARPHAHGRTHAHNGWTPFGVYDTPHRVCQQVLHLLRLLITRCYTSPLVSPVRLSSLTCYRVIHRGRRLTLSPTDNTHRQALVHSPHMCTWNCSETRRNETLMSPTE
jgi:hypothetical protein